MSNVYSETQRFIGRVKWFNTKNGYGFLEYKEGDIFVHHTALVVPKAQFRYLVQGEYVEFTPAERTNDSSESRWTANDVTGPLRGKLMCQTEEEERENHYNNEGSYRFNSAHRSSGGPRSTSDNDYGSNNWKNSGRVVHKAVRKPSEMYA